MDVRSRTGWRCRFGRAAEDHAAAYLERRGLEIVGRRLRLGRGELDLVAVDGDTLVFVEVRARRSGPWGKAKETIDARKRGRLRSAAGAYARRYGVGASVRFDVVAIEAAGGRLQIEWLRDAFRP